VGGMLDRVPPALRRRTGYGLDTCHLYSAGLDITASAAALTGILDRFEEAAASPPAFFHLNDSEGTLGSNKDRHVLIGEGRIGSEPFRWLIHDRRSAGVPLILETPQQNYDVAEDDDAPDAYDVRMVELLRSFEG
jgi:deoxyribonuclease IV